MKSIEIKYDVGDNIRYLVVTKTKIMETCPCCDGKGYVIGVDGNQYECGECEGKKELDTGKRNFHETEKTGTISSVHAHYDSNMARNGTLGGIEIYYNVPQSRHNIYQDQIIERVVSEQEKLAYSD